jgi:hypothetical protein
MKHSASANRHRISRIRRAALCLPWDGAFCNIGYVLPSRPNISGVLDYPVNHDRIVTIRGRLAKSL